MGRWITVKGTHVYIKDGESVAQAFHRETGKDINEGNKAPTASEIVEQYKQGKIKSQAQVENVISKLPDLSAKYDFVNRESSTKGSLVVVNGRTTRLKEYTSKTEYGTMAKVGKKYLLIPNNANLTVKDVTDIRSVMFDHDRKFKGKK
ncbi:hypothetical protein SAMN04487977_101469 [Treponema bryantii]|uniref:Uncharacterized protein n=1 Tax=Treponema bryantii TaxID=163 RepID=A0A1H9AW83_9SPIR|nr:hypothetical protein [Treponema bryantii]SEP80198.1 hypothetical protein SAMN04487977_101469 [Treponema bryantii]